LTHSYKRIFALAAVLALVIFPLSTLAEESNIESSAERKGVAWSKVLCQSGLFLGLQSSVRVIYEEETRRDMAGPFFKDYFESVRGLHGWDDGDPFAVNYLGHPWMGAVAGRIFVNNDPIGKGFSFSNEKLYWKSRLKALGWSAVYSTTFELSPAGEAALGNIGGKPWPDGMTYGDLVVTPVLGTGILITEDLADRYVLGWLERQTGSIYLMAATRTILNPARSVSNLLGFRWPWHRDSRSSLRMNRQMHQSTAAGHRD
jgi:hypothetical protein